MDYNSMTVPELDDLLDAQGLSKDGLKQDKIDRLMDAEKSEEETPKAGMDEPEVQDRKAVIQSLKAKRPYAVRMWAGKIPVYICENCGLQRDDEEQMVLHVVGHYPLKERQDVFDYLVKELEHE